MANLAYKQVDTNGEYVDFETEMGITFTLDSKYQIQVQNSAIVCISNTKPTTGGFVINDIYPFGYKHLGSKLWIKTTYHSAWVNVAEG